MKPLDQERFPLKIIQDLGMQKATETSKLKKRFAMFECPDCLKPYRSYTQDVRVGKSNRCKECKPKYQSTTLKNLESGYKTCGTCKKSISIKDFYRCKVCDAKARRQWAEDNPERSRESSKRRQLKSKYNMTIEEFNALLEGQDGVCKICSLISPPFSVDHCHTTGKVRGLLCNQCNRGLGMLGDTSEQLKKAYDYLIESEADTH